MNYVAATLKNDRVLLKIRVGFCFASFYKEDSGLKGSKTSHVIESNKVGKNKKTSMCQSM